MQESNLVSWGTFHSSDEDLQSRPSVISALLPLLPNEAKSVALIKHSMNIVKQSVDHLNPEQTPVVALDQPLFAVAKEIQWHYPETHGEDKFLRHVRWFTHRTSVAKGLGDWLDGSGWTAALAEGNVAMAGTAESFLKASNIAKTRRAHQVFTTYSDCSRRPM